MSRTVAASAGVPAPTDGTVVAAVDALAAACKFPDDDPRAVSLAVARRLGEALDADAASTLAAGRLTDIVKWLAFDPAGPPDAVDAIRAKVHAREVERLTGRSTVRR